MKRRVACIGMLLCVGCVSEGLLPSPPGLSAYTDEELSDLLMVTYIDGAYAASRGDDAKARNSRVPPRRANAAHAPVFRHDPRVRELVPKLVYGTTWRQLMSQTQPHPLHHRGELGAPSSKPRKGALWCSKRTQPGYQWLEWTPTEEPRTLGRCDFMLAGQAIAERPDVSASNAKGEQQ